MGGAKATHIVTHNSLYLRVNKKLQQMEKGERIVLAGAQAKSLENRGFVEKIRAKAPTEPGKKDK